jgi:hypothetical protein
MRDLASEAAELLPPETNPDRLTRALAEGTTVGEFLALALQDIPLVGEFLTEADA